MVDFNILHSRWMALAILGGLVLLFSTVLTYYAIWRPRGDEGQHIATQKVTGPVSFVKWWVTFVPWILTLTYLGIATYGIWYVLARMAHPPNW